MRIDTRKFDVVGAERGKGRGVEESVHVFASSGGFEDDNVSK